MKCKSCEQKIWFVPTQGGKKIPLNLPSKKVFIIQDGVAVLTYGYTPHWATCTQPKKHKKTQTKDRRQVDLFTEGSS